MKQEQSNDAARLEHYKTVNAAGDMALKSSLLINGAAAVALLAFLGNLCKEGKLAAQSTGTIPYALLFFVGGVLLAAVAAGVKYLAMRHAFPCEKEQFTKRNNWSIFLVGTAYVAFLVGGILAFLAFR